MRKDTIQVPPMPNEWAMPITWLKWFYDLYLLVTGREGRQNFINTLTNTKQNNNQTSTLFVNKSNGDATFLGTEAPYINKDNGLVIPTTVTADKRSVANVGALRAFQSAPQTIQDLTDTIMIFDLVEFDDDSAFNTGTGQWTPTQAGKYAITAQVAYDGADVVISKYVQIYLSKNGIDYAASQAHTSTPESITVSVSGLMEMNGTTDYMYVIVSHNFGVGTPTFGQNFACYLIAHKVN